MSFDWTGPWAVSAQVPGGGGYSGRIDIAAFGEGYALSWSIKETGANAGDGRYFGVGLAEPEGLYVACGPCIEGLSLIVFDGAGRGRWIGADTDAAAIGGAITAEATGPDAWRLSGSGARNAAIRTNGEALLARIETGAGAREGLAWREGARVALGWGCPPERLVMLFYRAPAGIDAQVDARWALGRAQKLGTETLLRLR